MSEIHLDVYKDRSELHNGETTTVYREGKQDSTTLDRYKDISKALEGGFLEKVYTDCLLYDYRSLDSRTTELVDALVKGVTEACGRAIVALTFAQLSIKTIAPSQCIRLHKGSKRKGSFSWIDGISIRTLDRSYFTPFLRKYGLISLNADGFMMTRSLAENYPYSQVYKADMRGSFKEWISIVDAVEDGTINPKDTLYYLTASLINRSNRFESNAQRLMELLHKSDCIQFLNSHLYRK